jgi:hypothetical protein
MTALTLIAAAVLQALPAAAPDYAQDAAWLCRPARADACAVAQDVTVIRTDGKRRVERFRPIARPAFDCFYVYPTVSTDPAGNSDMVIGDEERQLAAAQAARFTSKCRVFAPVYRQVTLTALRAAMTGQPNPGDRALALADVTAAWNAYLARDNAGRGVVLIGHSQGATVLKALIAQSVEGRPVQRNIISAMLIGTNVAVPAGADVGGDLKRMPLCRKSGQYGCVIAYTSFRADSPPSPDSRFGRVAEAGLVAACTNPAALGGGKAAADAILGANGAGMSSTKPGPWSRDGAAVTTPFVKVPGLLTTECVARNGATYLAVTVNADPADARTDAIVGDVTYQGRVLADWGLHLVDMAVVMGDLVRLADTQAQSWRGIGLPPK